MSTRFVTTYSTPRGNTIRLCDRHIAEGEREEWYRNGYGEEYCEVSHGRHAVGRWDVGCDVCGGRAGASEVAS